MIFDSAASAFHARLQNSFAMHDVAFSCPEQGDAIEHVMSISSNPQRVLYVLDAKQYVEQRRAKHLTHGGLLTTSFVAASAKARALLLDRNLAAYGDLVDAVRMSRVIDSWTGDRAGAQIGGRERRPSSPDIAS